MGLSNLEGAWCACFRPTYHPTMQNPVVVLRVPNCNTPQSHRVSTAEEAVDEQSAHGVSGERPFTTPEGTPAGCLCLIGGGDEIDIDADYWDYWKSPVRLEGQVGNVVSKPAVA